MSEHNDYANVKGLKNRDLYKQDESKILQELNLKINFPNQQNSQETIGIGQSTRKRRNSRMTGEFGEAGPMSMKVSEVLQSSKKPSPPLQSSTHQEFDSGYDFNKH